jgi:plasmid stabilization system protein ParE
MQPTCVAPSTSEHHTNPASACDTGPPGGHVICHQATIAGGLRTMPRAWSNRDERQFERIKESSIDRGVDEDRAEEIAGRTVNKRRREEGRTPNRRTQGTGNPNQPLEAHSRDELYNRARELNISGRSSMTKDELVKAVRSRGR